MYIKLGQTQINTVASADDFMIISEVLDSDLSLEVPALVRTIDELNIWFGKNIKDRGFLIELLNSGITLYVYKPILTSSAKYSDNVDYDNYVNVSFLGLSEIPEYYIEFFQEFKLETGNVVYKLSEDRYVYWDDNRQNFLTASPDQIKTWKHWTINEVEPKINAAEMKEIKVNDNIKINVKTGNDTKELYIWYDYQLVSTSLLPQNLQPISSSINNRSTLLLTTDENIKYYYPEFSIDQPELFLTTPDFLEGKTIKIESNDQKDLDNETKVALLSLEISLKEGEYLMLPIESEENKNICIKSGTISEDVSKYYTEVFDIVTSSGSLSNFLNRNGYYFSDIREDEGKILIDNLYLESDGKIIPVPFTEFTNSNNVIFTPEKYNTNVLLSNSIEKETRSLELWSKTIGWYSDIDAEEMDITVTVEDVDSENNYYRITLTRCGYSEVYEGYTIGSPERERIDSRISRESRLVYCNLLSPKLPIGTWKLKGGTKEEKTPDMWLKSLSELYNERAETVCPDFFLVPRIRDYTGETIEKYVGDNTYLPIYDTFLEYAKTYSSQFLIQNSEWLDYNLKIVDSADKIIRTPLTAYKMSQTEIAYDKNGNIISDTAETHAIVTLGEVKNESAYNKSDDIHNYLVYFYRDMQVNDYQRPGYYAFLYGILTNNYSINSSILIYSEPNEDPYNENELELKLIDKKSNYLVSNNQEYYYKRYLSGKKYSETIWMRFTAGKIKRELVKNNGLFLGAKFIGKMERDIRLILNRITESFSIIRRIELTKLEKREAEGALDIYVTAESNDLIGNNITLDITINYNNKS